MYRRNQPSFFFSHGANKREDFLTFHFLPHSSRIAVADDRNFRSLDFQFRDRHLASMKSRVGKFSSNDEFSSFLEAIPIHVFFGSSHDRKIGANVMAGRRSNSLTASTNSRFCRIASGLEWGQERAVIVAVWKFMYSRSASQPKACD